MYPTLYFKISLLDFSSKKHFSNPACHQGFKRRRLLDGSNKDPIKHHYGKFISVFFWNFIYIIDKWPNIFASAVFIWPFFIFPHYWIPQLHFKILVKHFNTGSESGKVFLNIMPQNYTSTKKTQSYLCQGWFKRQSDIEVARNTI